MKLPAAGLGTPIDMLKLGEMIALSHKPGGIPNALSRSACCLISSPGTRRARQGRSGPMPFLRSNSDFIARHAVM